MTNLSANFAFSHAKVSPDCKDLLDVVDGVLGKESFVFFGTLLSIGVAGIFV